jgi:uncharacterized protein YkwD
MRVGSRLWILIVAGVMVCAPAYGQTAAKAERDLFAAVNQARAAQGLRALRWDESLAAAARLHAAVMADHGMALHTFEGEPTLSARAKQAGAHFGWLSENVALGPTTEFIHERFMNSPSHRANVLDRDMDSIGVGVVERKRQLFAVEDFSQAR